jgi:8-hydroxy-5-deazaflavin:NADPH oxidoreductase
MKIGVIGAGNIGGVLGRKWAQAGHNVVFGVRNPESPKSLKLKADYPEAVLCPTDEAINRAEAVLLSTPYAAVTDIARANARALAGKIVIDSTNNFAGPVINNIAAILEAASDARVFRAFNSTGWENFAQPKYGDQDLDHFYAGPDNEARPVVEQLIAEAGLHPVWVGGLETASLVDALGKLWVTLVFQRGYPRSMALQLIQR